MRILAATTALAVAMWLASAPAGAAIPNKPLREQEVLRISKNLKPISNDQWRTIAGERITQIVEVIKGDTLYDISARLFGDPKYWPKVWALNNERITNPHFIKPGYQIAFLPGTGSELPGLQLNEDGKLVDAQGNIPVGDRTISRSQEWKQLPRQRWEDYVYKPSKPTEEFSINRASLQGRAGAETIDLSSYFSSEKIDSIGEIRGSTSLSEYLMLGDTIYIESDSGLQTGETYSLCPDPNSISPSGFDGTGYSYLKRGTVLITGVRDGLYIGTIQSTDGLIDRDVEVYPWFKPVSMPEPIPGPEGVEGVMGVERDFTVYSTAQHKQVFMDRGSESGVQPGMVFRHFQHRDPATDSRITSSDMIPSVDILVLQTSSRHSTGVILRSVNPITEGARVVLLTDVSDLNPNYQAAPPPTVPMDLPTEDPMLDYELDAQPQDDQLDQLDELDQGGELTDQEKKTLEQLEGWEKNPDNLTPAPVPSESLPGSGTPPDPFESLEPFSEGAPPPTAEPSAMDMELDGPMEAVPPPSDSGGAMMDSIPSAPVEPIAPLTPEVPTDDASFDEMMNSIE